MLQPHTLILGLAFGLAALLQAESTGFGISETPGGGLKISHDGSPFAEYVVDQVNKPYLYPVFGPGGVGMTRAYPMENVEGEVLDHPHHRGIWFGHESVGGADSWAENRTFEEQLSKPKSAEKARARLKHLGGIRHIAFKDTKAGKDSATIIEECSYTDGDGKKLLSEERRMTFRVANGKRLIDFDQDLTATEGDVILDDRKDAGLSIRVPTSMSVDTGKGGTIVTSEGKTNKDAWSTSAAWCDYWGPVDGKTVGVAILNHPSSFRHPTGWHVRTYGLFTANPFASQQFEQSRPSGAVELKKGETLKLRHRFVFHEGDEKAADIAGEWKAYSAEKR